MEQCCVVVDGILVGKCPIARDLTFVDIDVTNCILCDACTAAMCESVANEAKTRLLGRNAAGTRSMQDDGVIRSFDHVLLLSGEMAQAAVWLHADGPQLRINALLQPEFFRSVQGIDDSFGMFPNRKSLKSGANVRFHCIRNPQNHRVAITNWRQPPVAKRALWGYQAPMDAPKLAPKTLIALGIRRGTPDESVGGLTDEAKAAFNASRLEANRTISRGVLGRYCLPCDKHTVGEEKCPKSWRAQMFAQFVLQRIIARYSAPGSTGAPPRVHVVDVAGGKGLVATALLAAAPAGVDLRCTLLDPWIRPSVANGCVAKLLVNSGKRSFDVIQGELNADFSESEVGRTLLSSSTDEVVFVGMHPDEATEPIVECALRSRRPFAVVPCCAFPTLHPERRLLSGGPVETTADFVQYLMERVQAHMEQHKLAAVVIEEHLGFAGRDRVLAWIPHGLRGS
jgi:hypothetical protein